MKLAIIRVLSKSLCIEKKNNNKREMIGEFQYESGFQFVRSKILSMYIFSINGLSKKLKFKNKGYGSVLGEGQC